VLLLFTFFSNLTYKSWSTFCCCITLFCCILYDYPHSLCISSYHLTTEILDLICLTQLHPGRNVHSTSVFHMCHYFLLFLRSHIPTEAAHFVVVSHFSVVYYDYPHSLCISPHHLTTEILHLICLTQLHPGRNVHSTSVFQMCHYFLLFLKSHIPTEAAHFVVVSHFYVVYYDNLTCLS
jgi:hypothetical protein